MGWLRVGVARVDAGEFRAGDEPLYCLRWLVDKYFYRGSEREALRDCMGVAIIAGVVNTSALPRGVFEVSSRTYPVISQRCQTLSYPLFGVPVTDCDVESEDDEHAQENGPFDNDAGLVMWTCVSLISSYRSVGMSPGVACV